MRERTYRQAAARNVEVGDVIRFGGAHWMRVAKIADELDGKRRTFYDTELKFPRRFMRKDSDEIIHLLDREV